VRIPLSWLADFVDLTGTTPEGLAETLTFGGLEVEAVRRPTSGTRGVVVALVRATAPIPGSDKLTLVEAFDGQRSWEIVCGASNFAVGDRVPVVVAEHRLEQDLDRVGKGGDVTDVAERIQPVDHPRSEWGVDGGSCLERIVCHGSASLSRLFHH